MTAPARLGRLLGAGLLIQALFLLPGWWIQRTVAPPILLLEALLICGVFALLGPGRRSRVLAWGVSCTVVVLGFFALGDVLARQSLARPLNLILDLALIDAVARLLSGNIGPVLTILSFVGLATGLLGIGWGLGRLLMPPRELPPEARRTLKPVGAGLVLFAAIGMAGIGPPAHSTLTAMPVVWLVRDQVRHTVRMLGERERFEAEMAARPATRGLDDEVLRRLQGRDVVMAFVESYGMTALDRPDYRQVIGPTLERLGEAVDAAGLHMATGRLVAPSQGGQSWLGHGSVLSGLWLENQLRYDLLLAGSRETLIDDFRRAGYRTVAIMPAITLAWPEGGRFGYDEIYTRAEIDYEGPALHWVTMPDQFTWSFLERIRGLGDGRPLFAEIGLISSHAPWTPILSVLDDWDSIGNGRVFERWDEVGETPSELWKDHDRVREHYALSVNYALEAATSYIQRYVDDQTILILLGDHQPAPMITGEGADRAVPVHVISGDPELVRPFTAWGFLEGPFPPPEVDVARMDAFRPWFVRTFTEAAAATTHAPHHAEGRK